MGEDEAALPGRLAAEVDEAMREGIRPYLEALMRLARDPAMQALAREYERDPASFAARVQAARAAHRPCHCLCARLHPDDKGICEAARAVTTRRFTSDLTGPVDVSLCAPCAVAQGLAELTDPPA